MSTALVSMCLLAQTASATSIAERNHWKPVYVTPKVTERIPLASLERLSNAGATIPFWISQVTSPVDNITYPFEMVGTSPFNRPATTLIHIVPIVLKVEFGNDVTLDPERPGCGDHVSVTRRFFTSPLFEDVRVSSNGIAVGRTQLVDAFQRAEWWSTIGGSNKYHVRFKTADVDLIHVSVDAPAGSSVTTGVCPDKQHDIGLIDATAYDAIARKIVNKYATPTQLPIILTYNIFLTSGGCCILGYHSAYSRHTGEQTYSVGAYSDAGIFGTAPIEDIAAWTHEIGEWMNDPFVQTDGDNFTPAWGHIGQVSGCQNNLEVGDPLSGTGFTVTFNGFTYHPQELVFWPWFYRVPSTGTGGLFSFNGTFTADAGPVCT
jgi:hypothetical protein